MDAAKLGTLHHQFLQRMSLAGSCDLPDLQQQLSAMVEQRRFSAEAAAALDLKSVATFWAGEVGQKILGQRARIRREVPFTARFSPLELEKITGAPMMPELADEFVVVQGVADLLVVDEAELWLLDFKTDDVRKEDLSAKLELYRPQLGLYAAALEAIHRKPVRHRWLHFLKCGETVVV